MFNERFVFHMLTIAAVAVVILYMAWKGGKNKFKT